SPMGRAARNRQSGLSMGAVVKGEGRQGQPAVAPRVRPRQMREKEMESEMDEQRDGRRVTKQFNGAKVFSATMAHDRELLGDKVTAWLLSNPDKEIVDTVVTQSSDEAF